MDYIRKFEIDHTLKESLTYQSESFPIEICVDQYDFLPAHTLNCHWHDEFEFGLLLSGELEYSLNGVQTHLRQGDCVFINSGTMHMAQQLSDCHGAKMFIIAFSPAFLTENMGGIIYQKYFRPALASSFPGFALTEETETRKKIAEYLHQLYRLEMTCEHYELLCISLLCQLWSETMHLLDQILPNLNANQLDRSSEERAKAIMYYIRQHYSEDITIERISRSVNVSPSECFRSFKKYTQKTPVTYLNEYRLAQAAKRLRESSDSITEISSACGFSHSSYFCKLFKERYGVSPTGFRKNE